MEKTIELKNPVFWGDETIKSLTFKEMTTKELKKLPLEAKKYEDFLDIVPLLTGKPQALIDRLSIQDGLQCVEIVAGFFQNSQATGGK